MKKRMFFYHYLFCQFFVVIFLNSDASGTDGNVARVNMNLENDGGVVDGNIHEPMRKGAVLDNNNSPETVIP